MSIESAKLFNKRIETDEEFAKKVTACKDAQERKTLIHKAGFDFTASELMEAGMVLSDDDLDDIAAGGTKNFKLFCYVIHFFSSSMENSERLFVIA